MLPSISTMTLTNNKHDCANWSNRVLNHHNAIFASEKIYKIKLYLSDMLNTLIIKICQYKYKLIV